jgi:intracellular sulfur oxidation DsrE/DsrF family protein
MKPMKVVAQFNEDESDEIAAGLKNLKNALNEASKEQSEMNVKVVFFGGGLKTLSAKKDMWKLIDGLSKTKHVEFLACNNTMEAFGIKLTDLPPEFKTVGSGAFEVMKLENAGYPYFRP